MVGEQFGNSACCTTGTATAGIRREVIGVIDAFADGQTGVSAVVGGNGLICAVRVPAVSGSR